MPDIDKYSGNSDPILFMDGYLLAMGPLHLGDDTLLKIFPRYLTDIAHSWYLKNQIADITTIKELADAL